MLDFLEALFAQVVDRADLGWIERCIDDADEPVVPDALAAFFALFRFHNADHSDPHHASDNHRFVHQYQDVNGIAVLAHCGGHEPEVVRKTASQRQNFAQVKQAGPFIVFVLAPPVSGRIDDDVHQARFRIDCVKPARFAGRHLLRLHSGRSSAN